MFARSSAFFSPTFGAPAVGMPEEFGGWLDPVWFAPGDSGAGELGLVNRGGPSPEFELSLGFSDPEGVADGVEDAGAFAESGAGLAPVVLVGVCVSRGAWSAISMLAGFVSAFTIFFSGSDPVACHTPVPIHGVGTLAELLCNALPIVNSPREFPARSPSYTVPESKAIGTGSALYALASQNLPLIMIAIGTSDTFPFASILRTARARGPASFFR